MVYSVNPPYEILRNKSIDFASMQQLRRFARYWDLIGNSGNFIETAPLIWATDDPVSPFRSFMRWSDWLYGRIGRTDSIALVRLMEHLFNYLGEEMALDRRLVAQTMWRDYQRAGRRDKPPFLERYLPSAASGAVERRERSALPNACSR